MPLNEELCKSFGILYLQFKDSGTLHSHYALAGLLITVLKTGLVSDKRAGEYKKEFAEAGDYYKQILLALQVPERRLWTESTTIGYAQKIEELLLPLCVANKYINLEPSLFNTINKKDQQNGD
jgi:hypothetical protein